MDQVFLVLIIQHEHGPNKKKRMEQMMQKSKKLNINMTCEAIKHKDQQTFLKSHTVWECSSARERIILEKIKLIIKEDDNLRNILNEEN